MPQTTLCLKELAIPVFLGWSSSEREKAQTVYLDIHLNFAEKPRACTSDQLADTQCYDTLVKTLQDHLADRSFKLIEHLSEQIYLHLKSVLPQNAKISLRLQKRPKSYIPALQGGVYFTYGDESLTWSY